MLTPQRTTIIILAALGLLTVGLGYVYMVTSPDFIPEPDANQPVVQESANPATPTTTSFRPERSEVEKSETSQQEATSEDPEATDEISFEELMDTSTWKVFESEELGVSFMYPGDWTIDDRTENFGDQGTIRSFNPGKTAISEKLLWLLPTAHFRKPGADALIELNIYSISDLNTEGFYYFSKKSLESTVVSKIVQRYPIFFKRTHHKNNDLYSEEIVWLNNERNLAVYILGGSDTNDKEASFFYTLISTIEFF